jgi:hypothetical protein
MHTQVSFLAIHGPENLGAATTASGEGPDCGGSAS